MPTEFRWAGWRRCAMRYASPATGSPRGGCCATTCTNTTHPLLKERPQATILRLPDAQTMATHVPPAREQTTTVPPLSTTGGQPVSVVHVTAEYYPYARTGGLAEAVSGLARFQKA